MAEKEKKIKNPDSRQEYNSLMLTKLEDTLTDYFKSLPKVSISLIVYSMVKKYGIGSKAINSFLKLLHEVDAIYLIDGFIYSSKKEYEKQIKEK